MTWEETIIYAREKEEFKQLIKDAYLEADLKKNAERFLKSDEFVETLRLIRKHCATGTSDNLKLLDIGAGNGISSVAFALNKFTVIAVEPDSSATVGASAIEALRKEYHLTNLDVVSSLGESLPFETGSIDVVYARQAMHHAAQLDQFISEASRVLKKNGILITCRDHVVNDPQQKEEFLKGHPFQKFYKGENAFSLDEYKNAFTKNGLVIKEELGPLDSCINYGPRTKSEFTTEFRQILSSKIRMPLPDTALFNNFIFALFKWKTGNLNTNAGRLYSFVAKKVNT